MDKLEFWTICSANGIVLDKEQVDLFERYHRDLLHWNEKVNLISRKDEDNIWERHLLHSLGLLTQVEFPQKARVLDIGTGGGFPGLPLKIARQDLRVVCADSIAKKIKLTGMFADHTGLRGITVLNTRVEELVNNPQYAAAFDCIVARAVAPLEELVGWTKALLKKGGHFAFLKGGDLNEEIAHAQQKFPNLNIEVRPLQMRGLEWFEEQEKKIVLASFSQK